MINQKGGCGKSSTAFHLGGCLAQSGLRTLLVDADPQGSLSQGFFGSACVETLETHETLAALFHDGDFIDTAALAVATPFANLSIVRTNQLLAPHNVPSPEQTGLLQFALDGWLNVSHGFDIVLIDCPPNLYQCSWNALLAADFVLVPVPPEDFGTQGLRVVHQAIDQARKLNPRLTLLGHLVTRYDRRLIVHQTYHRKLRQLYGQTVLQAVLPEASAYKVSLACRTPVTFYSRSNAASDCLQRLADEVLQRTTASDRLVCQGNLAP